jgi:hypothetical protein
MPWVDGIEVEDHELPSSWSSAFSYESFLESLNWRKKAAWEAALELSATDYKWPDLIKDEFGILTPDMKLRCPQLGPIAPEWKRRKYNLAAGGKPCHRPAGQSTPHEGIGLCFQHGGNYGKGLAEGAIMMAIRFADEMDVTPWEALLQQVRLLYNQVKWLQMRVENAEREFGADAIKPGGQGWDWVCMLESRGDRLAKVSKMAIDAGVATMLVRQIELEAENMVTAALETFERLGIMGTQRDEALEFMGNKLLELEQAGRTYGS